MVSEAAIRTFRKGPLRFFSFILHGKNINGTESRFTPQCPPMQSYNEPQNQAITQSSFNIYQARFPSTG